MVDRRDNADTAAVRYDEDREVWEIVPDTVEPEAASEFAIEVFKALAEEYDAACMGCGQFLEKGVRMARAEQVTEDHMAQHGGPTNVSHVLVRSKVEEILENIEDPEDHTDHEPDEAELARSYTRTDPRGDPREKERHRDREVLEP